MKKIFYISFLLLLVISLPQCETDYDDLVTENAKTGGLVDISNKAMNYVVGDGATYSYNLFVHQNAEAPVSKINIYKSCYRVAVPWSNPDDTTHTAADSIRAKWSNEILQETINITESTSHWVSATGLDFAGLRQDLTIDDDPLPTSDGDMRIGDYFNFKIETVLSDGTKNIQSAPVKMTISTRFAGTYEFVSGEYWRIGVLTDEGSYWEPEYVIESIDAITYKMFGVCAWMDQVLYFQIDGDGNITYPETWDGVDQIINGEPLITCDRNASDMTNVNCGASNYVIKDDVNGKDQLIMSFGYYTGGSGPREFYQVLKKK